GKDNDGRVMTLNGLACRLEIAAEILGVGFSPERCQIECILFLASALVFPLAPKGNAKMDVVACLIARSDGTQQRLRVVEWHGEPFDKRRAQRTALGCYEPQFKPSPWRVLIQRAQEMERVICG